MNNEGKTKKHEATKDGMKERRSNTWGIKETKETT